MSVNEFAVMLSVAALGYSLSRVFVLIVEEVATVLAAMCKGERDED